MGYIKQLCLIVLVIQTTTNVLLVRKSRSQDKPYSVPVLIFLQEILKLLTCLVVLFLECNRCVESTVRMLRSEIMIKWKDTLRVGVPAFAYVVQNQLLFLALSNLDAATYQVTYQLKILTTAAFSVLLLRKRLVVQQWVALFILTVGVSLVQWPQDGKATSDGSSIVGVVAVFLACITSGFAGVYFEMVLKGSKQSLWLRNIQLALCSVVIALANMLLTELHTISHHGLLSGFTPIVWGVVISQAGGGLLIGLVVKYADNILKVFATSISIILSSLISFLYFTDFTPSPLFVGGTCCVLMSTFLYSVQPKPKVEEKAE